MNDDKQPNPYRHLFLQDEVTEFLLYTAQFHFAITGQTSSELIYHKADSNQPLMGMSNYKNALDGRAKV